MTSPEERFYYNICELADFLLDLTQLCADEGVQTIDPKILAYGKSLLANYDKTYLIDNFINYTNEYWEEIRTHNVNFFLQHGSSIFGSLPIGNVNLFQVFYTANDRQGNPILTEEDKETLWSYFSALVRISIKYIHEKRKPKLVQTPKGLQPSYKVNFMSNIKVRQHANAWEIELPGFNV